LNSTLQQVAAGQWASQKVIEKRIAVFDEVAPALNDLYCFFKFVGHWKELTPPTVVAHKRRIDKTLHVYAAMFPASMLDSYYTFINLYFRSYAGPDHDAKLRTAVLNERWGNRQKSLGKAWDPRWAKLFVPASSQIASREAVTAAYFSLMDEFSRSLGLGIDPTSSERKAAVIAEALTQLRKADEAEREADGDHSEISEAEEPTEV
jgi:hypothetical protein